METTTTVHDCCVGFNIGRISMRFRLNKGPFRHQNIKILFAFQLFHHNKSKTQQVRYPLTSTATTTFTIFYCVIENSALF